MDRRLVDRLVDRSVWPWGGFTRENMNWGRVHVEDRRKFQPNLWKLLVLFQAT